jgi:hypothetical protein
MKLVRLGDITADIADQPNMLAPSELVDGNIGGVLSVVRFERIDRPL